TFAARRIGRKGVMLGFNERQSNKIVGLEECAVLDSAIVAVIEPLRAALAGLDLPEGETVDIAVARLGTGLDMLLTGPASLTREARERLGAFAEGIDLARLSWRPKASADSEPVAHRRAVLARFGDADVPVPPAAFLQASRAGEEALVAAAVKAVGEAASVADLFAGCGTFTFPLAARAAVHAVEGDAAALSALTQAAHAQPGRRITTERRDLARDPLTAKELSRYQAVVFDPPRVGAGAQADALAQSSVPVAVGVSCNPATFARDARRLVDGGFRLERVVPVDQFLWSPHVELVGVFRR
ncbi:MAG TPA: class I SAM-dependent RNA methyltransferase, partial [Azospirillaceae bacterium]|nr:class I SAM-dependent RNA methyltransferase [Azospirillaceae bacterium]